MKNKWNSKEINLMGGMILEYRKAAFAFETSEVGSAEQKRAAAKMARLVSKSEAVGSKFAKDFRTDAITRPVFNITSKSN